MKIYFETESISITEEGLTFKNKGIFHPVEIFTKEIEQVVEVAPRRFRAFFWFLGACFVFSEATVSKAPFPPEMAYIVSAFLFLGALYFFFHAKIKIDAYLNNGQKTRLWTKSYKEADRVTTALHKMFNQD